MIADRPTRGLLLMLGFCLVAPMGDAVAKLLGQSVPTGQILLIRFAVQAALLIPLVVLTGRPWRLRRGLLGLVFLRSLMHILGIGLMISALKVLPLADAVAIAFVMPFLILLLGRLLLSEAVGARRILACAVGFAGTLMVIQPHFENVGPAALLPLAVALNFAFFILLTRRIAKETDPLGLQAVSGLMAVAVLLPFLALGLGMEAPPALLALSVPSAADWALLFGIGALGTLAHLLMTWSLRFAPSATLAPMQYLEIPVAAVLGWLVFHDWPDGLALLGIVITSVAGLYIVLTERPASAPAPGPTVPRSEAPSAQPAE